MIATTQTNPDPLLSRIYGWHLGAESDQADSIKYFVPDRLQTQLTDIQRGSIPLILGNKGLGKTALAKFLASERNDTFYVEFDKLFDELQSFAEDQEVEVSTEHQIRVAFLLLVGRIADSELFSEEVRKELRRLTALPGFAFTPWWARLPPLRPKVGGENLAASIDVKETDRTPAHIKAHRRTQLQRRADAIQRILETRDKPAIFLIDRIDNAWARATPSAKRLMTSLFESWLLTTLNTKSKTKIVLFIREDIFNVVKIHDANKIPDFKLAWDSTELHSLIMARVEAEIAELNLPRTASSAFQFQLSTEQKGELTRFLAVRTFLRPRDVIHLVKTAAGKAISERRESISRANFQNSFEQQAAHIVREIRDELEPFSEEAYKAALEFIERGVPGNGLFDAEQLVQYLERKFPNDSDRFFSMLYTANVFGRYIKTNTWHFFFNGHLTCPKVGKCMVHPAIRMAVLEDEKVIASEQERLFKPSEVIKLLPHEEEQKRSDKKEPVRGRLHAKRRRKSAKTDRR